MATTAPRQPELAAQADGNGVAPEGRLGARGVALALLRVDRAAEGPGVSRRDFAEAGVRNAAAHLESLRMEGHGLEVLHGTDERGALIERYRLTTDTWEGS